MTDIQTMRAAILDLVNHEEIPLIKSPSVSRPSDAGALVIPLDDEATDATRQLLRHLAPSMLILGSREDDEVSLDLHLVGRLWVQLLYVTPEALSRAEEDEVEENTSEVLTEAEEDALSIAVNTLVDSTPLSSHGGMAEAHDRLLGFLKDANPALHAKMARPWMRYHKLGAESLNLRLKDSHSALLRDGAESLARQVISDEKLTPKMSRTLLRDRIYSHFKRLDPTCVTKSSIEGIYCAVADLFTVQGS